MTRMTASKEMEKATMREEQRDLARRKLDKELRYYRMAAREEHPTPDLLKAVRQALGVPVAEIARVLKVSKSVVFRLEASERRRRISLRSMARLAAAMGCHIVYAVVPRDGGTLEEMAERRKWSRMLGENRS
jgi:DNA-binding transcriptional regulator YiaG